MRVADNPFPRGLSVRQIVPPNATGYRELAVPRPSTLVVERRWVTEMDKALALLAFVGFACLFAIPQGRNIETVLLAVLVTIYCIVRFSGRTILTVDGGISVKRSPLRLRAAAILMKDEIRQILSEEVGYDGRVVFRVVAVTRAEKRVALVDKLETPEQADYLVKEIEARVLG